MSPHPDSDSDHTETHSLYRLLVTSGLLVAVIATVLLGTVPLATVAQEAPPQSVSTAVSDSDSYSHSYFVSSQGTPPAVLGPAETTTLDSLNADSRTLFVLQNNGTGNQSGAVSRTLNCNSGFGELMETMYSRFLTLFTSAGLLLAVLGWQYESLKSIFGNSQAGKKAQQKNRKREIVVAGITVLIAPYLGWILLWVTGSSASTCVDLNPLTVLPHLLI